MLVQLAVAIIKTSIEKFKGDSHVQFHSLVLLDVVF